MKDFFSKMDKKFLYTSGLLISIPLLIIIVLMMLRGCQGKKLTYEKYQDKMLIKAKKYFEYHKLLPTNDGKVAVVTLDDLISYGLKSPKRSLKDSSCTGSVTVRNNNSEYQYIPYLDCKDYKTDYVINHLKKDIVTSESGLYQVGNEYIYKGNKVNNYISFFNTLYRIIKIDSNNNLRLVKVKREDAQVSWDDKYNVSVDENVGINDYYNSSIYDTLWKSYNNIKSVTKDMKTHMLSHDVCLDKKSLNDKSIEQPVCQNVLKNQYISIPSVYDYTNASYDENCKSIGDGACANFNYLDDVLYATWTVNASSDDTFSVYYLSGHYVDVQKAENYKSYYWIINISGNEIYQGGEGTLEKPYIIK